MALSKLAGDFGREYMLLLQHFFSSQDALVISTDSLKLDKALRFGQGRLDAFGGLRRKLVMLI